MEKSKKKRGENWSCEEKEILRRLIKKSINIIESKCLKTSTNLMKAKEWKNIKYKLNKVTGKSRAESEIRLAWKRMKLAAKQNRSSNRQQQCHTGSGEKSPSASQKDQSITPNAPYDIVIEVNNSDSDAAQDCHSPIKVEDIIRVPSCTEEEPSTVLSDDSNAQADNIVEQVESIATINILRRKNQDGMRIQKNEMTKSIVESKLKYLRRNLEMLEMEHAYNIKIAKLQIKKLELEIESLEIRKI